MTTMNSRYPTIATTTSTSLTGSKNNFRQFYDVHEQVNIADADIPRYMGDDAVKGIIENVIANDNCYARRSNSSCGLYAKELESVDPSEDPRLVNWQRSLQRRKKIQQRIQRHTGKRAEDVLFNRQSTIHQPNKQMLFRVLDNANRQNPTSVSKLKAGMPKLKARCDVERCREIRELVATKPKPRTLEYVALPEITQIELTNTKPCKVSDWGRSSALDQHIEENADDIKRVLEFAPHTDKLQVTSTWTRPTDVQMKKAFCYEENMREISTDTVEENANVTEKEELEEETTEEPPTVDLSMGGLKINGCVYSFREVVLPSTAEIQVMLQCDPHQRVVKTLLELENLGPKLLCGIWQLRRMRAQKGSMTDNNLESFEFVFDNRSFSLESDEHRRFDILFRPQCVGLFKQCWNLHLSQSPFCGTRTLIIRIQGLCTMPVIYRQRVDDDLMRPLKSHRKQIANNLFLHHANLATQMATMEQTGWHYPYNRTLDEREIFNAQNSSHKCERYGDLESLKELYDLMKKPRGPNWDLRIETLQELVLCQSGTIQRQTLQNRLLELLEPMKCGQEEVFQTQEFDREKERSCMIYVRGAINNNIDEWENMTIGLEQQFFKNAYQLEMGKKQKSEEEEDNDGMSIATVSLKDIEPEVVLKKVKGSKYFRDALYMQTYSLLCDAAENIVSIIESTGHG